HHLCKGDPGSVVDADMDELPAEPFATAAPVALAAAIASDAVADAVDPAELLDIDVDQLARVLALIAAHRIGRLQRAQPAQPEAAQDARDARLRDAGLARDLRPGPALASQCLDAFDGLCWRRSAYAVRSRGAVLQTGDAFAPEPLNPLAYRAWADAYGCTEGLRRLSTLDNPAHHDLSTGRRQPGILVYVHSVPPRFAKASATSASSVGTEWTTC